jgi:hypothetical protein
MLTKQPKGQLHSKLKLQIKKEWKKKTNKYTQTNNIHNQSNV